MKKIISIALLILINVAVFSQNKDSLTAINKIKLTDTTKTHKWELGGSFSPEYSYRTLKADETSQTIKEIRDTLEVAKFGYTVGLNLLYRLNNRLTIETGILLSDKGEKTKKTSFTDVPAGQKIMYYTYKYNYYYLGIPLKANYSITTGKLNLYVTAGVSANIFLTQKTTLITGHDSKDWERNTTQTKSGFNSVNFAMLAGLGLQYKLNNKINIKVEPLYTRSLTSVINAPVKSYLYSTGINFGISKTL